MKQSEACIAILQLQYFERNNSKNTVPAASSAIHIVIVFDNKNTFTCLSVP